MASHARAPLTEEQHAALATRDQSVALSAGAGCGKTFVLTERFLSHLDPQNPYGGVPARLDQLVAITFTERAAREMRERIRAACRARLFAADESEADYWLGLLRNLESAKIATIHAFCGSLLRSHAVEAGLDPRFTLLDEVQSALILAELVTDELRELLAARDPAAMDLVVRYTLSGVQPMIQELVAERHRIDFPKWLATTPDEMVAIWEQKLETMRMASCERLARGRRVRDFAAFLGQLSLEHEGARERRDQVLELIPRLASGRSLPDVLAELRAAAMVKGVHKKHWGTSTEEDYDRIRDGFTELRESIDDLTRRFAWKPEAARVAADLGLKLLAVTARVSTAYEAHKRELGALDFEDLIARARNLLADSAQDDLRRRLADNLKLLMIDEFQDTDPVQADLVERLCGEARSAGKLFFVGDTKQSIYRFRGADPSVFERLAQSMPSVARLPLRRNFRSQPAILSFVNYLFCKALADPVTLNYEFLRPHARQLSPSPAIEFLWATADTPVGPTDAAREQQGEGANGHASPTAAAAAGAVAQTSVANTSGAAHGDTEDRTARSDEGDREESPSVMELRRREAAVLARRIRLLIEDPTPRVRDKATGGQTLRRARAGDVVILLRAMSNIALYEAALREEGLAYYVVGGHAFYAQQEVFDVLNVLRVLAKPADAISLVGALRSPFFSVSDEAIFWLARQPGGLPRAVFDDELPAELAADDRRQLAFARQTLLELRSIKDQLPIAELLSRAVAMTGFDAILLGEFLGDRKVANLRKLIDLARSFDRLAMFTLDDYIMQLSDFVAARPKEAPAATQAENCDVVRIMSIHQSKGLEFPIVCVADANRTPRGGWQRVAFSPEYGPLVAMPALAEETATATGLQLYLLEEDLEDERERTRLFYVATTRAADHLVISSGVESLDDVQSPWMQLLSERFDLATGKLLDPAGHAELEMHLSADAYSLPEVRVTIGMPPGPPPPKPQVERWSPSQLVAELPSVAPLPVPLLVPPIAPEVLARRQYSVSRLHGMLERQAAPEVDAEVESFSLAADVERRRAAAQDLGTLVHSVLEVVDMRIPINLRDLVDMQAEKLRLPGDSFSNRELAFRLIWKFLNTKRYTEVARAAQLHRELEFLFAWPPDEPFQPEGLYLEGVIDCLYQNAKGHWVVLDYKTNRITADAARETSLKYEMQMLLYGLIAERLLGTSPYALVLHYLHPGVEYEFRWNAKTRKRAKDLVNDALRQLEPAEAAAEWATAK